MGRFFGGLVFVGIGFALAAYSGNLVDMFGRNSRAEINIGGTRQLYILSGFVLIVIGILIMVGVISGGPGTAPDNNTSLGQKL